MDPEEARHFGYVLKAVEHAMRLRLDAALAGHDLTTPQFSALATLQRAPGLSNAELARRSFVTPQTMIRIVENLERGGLVERRPHPAGGRILQTHLTRAGRRRLEGCLAAVREVEGELLAPLDPRQRKQLLEMLRTCFEAL